MHRWSVFCSLHQRSVYMSNDDELQSGNSKVFLAQVTAIIFSLAVWGTGMFAAISYWDYLVVRVLCYLAATAGVAMFGIGFYFTWKNRNIYALPSYGSVVVGMLIVTFIVGMIVSENQRPLVIGIFFVGWCATRIMATLKILS